jgi:hypothetical protein
MLEIEESNSARIVGSLLLRGQPASQFTGDAPFSGECDPFTRPTLSWRPSHLTKCYETTEEQGSGNYPPGNSHRTTLSLQRSTAERPSTAFQDSPSLLLC